MTTINRRELLQLGGLAALPAFGGKPSAFARGASVDKEGLPPPDTADERVVRLSGDGLGLTPPEYVRLLTRLIDERKVTPDSYILGGTVEELETHCARLLGKERAIFMPTGTLANHMAVRALANGASRVIVQNESHFYQDEGDCAQTLSNLTLMPLAPGKATFTADEVQQVIDQTRGGRVVPRVSVMAIETPVRRKQGERFDGAEMKKVIALAKREGIRLHLDGARLFLQAAYTGEIVAETARPFDTVYVSLYKYFNAASGAILAGPREVIDGMYHGRRMFGGGLSTVWPFSGVALHYLEGFGDRYSQAVRASEDLIRALGRHDGFAVERIAGGTNLFHLRVKTGDPVAFRTRLAAGGVMLGAPQRDTFLIGVNETLNRTTSAQLADALVHALAG
ncbi:MAG: beta-eliminating lyase-related protein [Vicinamibacterales bacterium]